MGLAADIVSPVLVARAMAARGARREAEIVLKGALMRDPSAADCRSELVRWSRGATPAASGTELTLELVDGWIREGMLVEALAVLGGVELGGPASEWANLLGELLAPVPAHAADVLVEMHRALLSGSASVAMALLEDRRREADLPGWAHRRLALLRWMLLDNARAAVDDGPEGEAPSLLAAAMRPALRSRSIERMLEAAREHGGPAPDPDTRMVIEALERLTAEMTEQVGEDVMTLHTVPVHGRPAAAMQLRMANFRGALAVYRKLSMSQPGESSLADLFAAMRGLSRVLEGRPFVDRSFPPPEARAFEEETTPFSKQLALSKSPMAHGGRPGGHDDITAAGVHASNPFDDVTADVGTATLQEPYFEAPGLTAALEAARAAPDDGSKGMSTWRDDSEDAFPSDTDLDNEDTREVVLSELPLSAFSDSETREVDLKDTDRISLPPKTPAEERPSVIVASIVGVGDE